MVKCVKDSSGWSNGQVCERLIWLGGCLNARGGLLYGWLVGWLVVFFGVYAAVEGGGLHHPNVSRFRHQRANGGGADAHRVGPEQTPPPQQKDMKNNRM